MRVQLKEENFKKSIITSGYYIVMGKAKRRQQ